MTDHWPEHGFTADIRHLWILSLCFTILIGQLPAISGFNDDADPHKVLSAAQWQRLDDSVERALSWTASQQQADGAFGEIPEAQPAITCLCILAFLSQGHTLGEGTFGAHLEQAVQYVLRCQRNDGLFSRMSELGTKNISRHQSKTAVYNHAISGLCLSELHGMSSGIPQQQIATAIKRALSLSMKLQDRPKRREESRDGWRYWHDDGDVCADLSVTSWHLMFLRSAKNAGFTVPSERIDRAMRFVTACYEERHHVFLYHPERTSRRTRAMTGAGILALSHGGMVETEMAQRAGDWLLAHPIERYRNGPSYPGWPPGHHFHYDVFYATAATYHLQGRYWREFYPKVVDTLITHQKESGAWHTEIGNAEFFGNVYTTALSILALNIPNQLLPILQR